MTTLTAVRAVREDDDWTWFEGLGIPFGGPFRGRDIYRTFADARTVIDHSLASADGTHPLLFDHGGDAALGFSRLGSVRVRGVDERGEWVEGQLSRHHEYHDAIRQLMDAGALAISSGSHPTGPRFDERSGHWERWVPVEYSLTPVEANPLAVISSVRSGEEVLDMVGAAPSPPAAGADGWRAGFEALHRRALRHSEAAQDASEGSFVLASMLSILGEEAGEPEQAAAINRAIDAWSDWLAMERAEVGSMGDMTDDDGPACMSARPAVRAGRRNSAADQAHVDAIHSHAAALGATAHQGDQPGPAEDDGGTPDEAAAARSADRQPAPGAVRQDAPADIDALRSDLRSVAREAATSYLRRP